ncbi:MAG: DMT family transporter [Acidimicrobiales bacterium]|nr:DMT family transporter [Acidimicrobiales bacterium]
MSGVAAVLLWSVGTVLVASLDLPGLQIAFWRVALGTVVYTTAFYVSGRRLTLIDLRRGGPAAVCFALQLGVAFAAVKTTSVANVTTITALSPLLLMAVSAFRYRELIVVRTGLAAFFAITGVVVITQGASATVARSNLHGDLLAILGMFLFALYFVKVKEARQHLETFALQTVTMIVGTLVLLPMAAIDAGSSVFSAPTWSQVGWIALLVAIPGTGHFFMNWAHLHISLTVSGLLVLGVPVLSAIGAWLILDQGLTAFQIGGMTIVLISLVVIVHQQPVQLPEGERQL